MLKKWILSMIMCLSLVGCGASENKFESHKTNELEKLNITLNSTEVVEKVQPTVFFNNAYYYEPTESDEDFLDMIMTVENKSQEVLKLQDLFAADFDIDGSHRVGEFLFESLDGTSLEKSLSLKSQQKTKIHVYANVSQKEPVEKIQLDMDIDDETYVLKETYQDLQGKKTYKQKDEKIAFRDQWTMTLKGLSTTKELKPSQARGTYSYYKPEKKNNTLVVFKTEIQNKTNQKLPLKGLVGCLFYLEDKVYDGYVVYENTKHNDVFDGKDGKIAAHQKMTVYYFAEIPESLKKKPIEVRITDLDQQYFVK